MRVRAPLFVEFALFAAVLLYVAGSAPRVPDPAGAARPAPPPPASPAPLGGGLSDRYDGFRLEPTTLPTHRGAGQSVAFRILGPDGAPAREYETVHTKPLHLYVIRDDLSGYQHLHPELVGDTWRALADVPDGGAYRLYAEFMPPGRVPGAHSTVLGAPFVIAGGTPSAPLAAPAAEAMVDGYRVRRRDGAAHLRAGRDALLTFEITAAGSPVRLERFLGASAHVSAFEALTGALVHLHPARRPGPDGSITLHVQFPNRGEQRVFLQFQVGGRIHQTAFTFLVT